MRRSGAPLRARAWRQRPVPARATLRIPLSEWLLCRVAQAAAAGGSERRFGPLEQAMHRFVFGWLPAGAREVELGWDEARSEVVASFRLDGSGP